MSLSPYCSAVWWLCLDGWQSSPSAPTRPPRNSWSTWRKAFIQVGGWVGWKVPTIYRCSLLAGIFLDRFKDLKNNSIVAYSAVIWHSPGYLQYIILSTILKTRGRHGPLSLPFIWSVQGGTFYTLHTPVLPRTSNTIRTVSVQHILQRNMTEVKRK